MKKLGRLSNRRQAFVLDALRLSFLTEDHAWDETWRALRELELAHAAGSTSETYVALALHKAWGLVDTYYRIRRLLKHVRGLKQNSSEIQAFRRGTEEIDDFRNHIQHLATFDPPAGAATPITGAISWASQCRTQSYTVIPYSSSEDIGAPSLAVDTLAKRFVTTLHIAAINKELRLCVAHELTQRLKVHIEAWLDSSGMLLPSPAKPSSIMFGYKQIEND